MTDPQQSWWVAAIADTLVWARLRVRESEPAEIFDASGKTLRYDDEDTARNALLDAAFREFDGLDEEDAAMMGFDLDSVEPPRADNDKELVALMTERLTPGHA